VSLKRHFLESNSSLNLSTSPVVACSVVNYCGHCNLVDVAYNLLTVMSVTVLVAYLMYYYCYGNEILDTVFTPPKVWVFSWSIMPF
jgi:hypothetical protein